MRLRSILVFCVLCVNQCLAQDTGPDARYFENSIGMKMVFVAPGNTAVGGNADDQLPEDDEKPQIEVEIKSKFWIQSTEVSRASFSLFCEETGFVTDIERQQNLAGLGTVRTWRDELLSQDPELPIERVSFEDACAFCIWLSGKERRRYRLPTEVEWEYACRSGSKGQFSDSMDMSSVCDLYCIGASEIESIRESKLTSRRSPWKCGTGGPNSFGIFDMHGNVSEIVDGYHTAYSEGIRQPSREMLPSDKFAIVTRGGSYRVGVESSRCSSRSWMKRMIGADGVGFRVVAE